jgi:hypothetical protein
VILPTPITFPSTHSHHHPRTHPPGYEVIASQFEDTWTKLRVFELYKYGCEKLGFLDADMLVRRNMDELFYFIFPETGLQQITSVVAISITILGRLKIGMHRIARILDYFLTVSRRQCLPFSSWAWRKENAHNT